MNRNLKLLIPFGLILVAFAIGCSSQTEEKPAVEEIATAQLKPAKIVYYAIPG